ncbi:hypothetical protein [Burkholderia sp. BCC1047]|uniref:hypothetical protein n=1 Tax=Burkholderia sp. BCC1047 TaxID=2676299 RepID=UPI001589DE3B|nr:hypothetical protein [Burkholderia sp. BCC1047]
MSKYQRFSKPSRQTSVASVVATVNVLQKLGADATICKLIVSTTIMTQTGRHPEVLAPGSHSYLGLKANTAIRSAQ